MREFDSCSGRSHGLNENIPGGQPGDSFSHLEVVGSVFDSWIFVQLLRCCIGAGATERGRVGNENPADDWTCTPKKSDFH